MNFSKEELRVIREALLKARARTETEGFETEKRVLDSLRTAPNEDVGVAVQDMYNRLLDKIQNCMDG